MSLSGSKQNMKMAVFWSVASCILVKVSPRFIGPFCHHHQLDFSCSCYKNVCDIPARGVSRNGISITAKKTDKKSLYTADWSDIQRYPSNWSIQNMVMLSGGRGEQLQFILVAQVKRMWLRRLQKEHGVVSNVTWTVPFFYVLTVQT